MPDKVTLVRHDGSLMDATPEQAQRLQLLGYKEITDDQNRERLQSEARADYYQTPGQEALATGEGIASGLTFGASDYWAGLWDNEDVKARAQYNPGTRFASEVVGAILPAFLTGGESFAATGARAAEEAGALSKFAGSMPTSLLSKAAHALVPEESLAGTIGRGIVEGGVYGGTGAADHAYLDGEPITAETVLHGIGFGALVGGAMAGLGHAIGSGGEAAAEAKAAELRASEPVPRGALNTMAGSEYGALRDEITNLTANTKQAIDIADASVKDVTTTLRKANTGYDAVRNFIDKERPINTQDVAMNFEREVGKLQSLYDKAAKAAEAGKFEAAHEAITDYAIHAKGIADKLGIEIPDPAKPLLEMASMRKMTGVLKAMPKSVEGFASLGSKKLEDLMAAIKVSKDLPFANNIEGAANDFIKALGVDSATGDVLRAAQKTAKGVYNSEGKPPKAPPQESKGPSLARRVVGYAAGGKAYLSARGIGLGRAGAYAAYRGVRDMVTYGTDHFVGLKAAALHGIRDAAAAWGPKLGKTVSTYVPRASALSYTLFGQPDTETKDRQALAKKRVQELYSFAPIAGDAIYRAVEPLSATQPLLAPSIHKVALQAIQAMLAMAPKDPGAMDRLKTLWQPSPLQAEILNKQLAVFHDPVGEAVGMLRSGNLDVTKLAAMKQIAPAIFGEMRLAMMGRISQPSVLDKLSPSDQLFISVALDIPLTSRAQPGYIATSQQMHMDRNQPLKANPRMGPGGGLPNPSDNNYATESQKSTER